MFSGANGAPDSIIEVVLLPFLFTFFAIAGRVAARTYWRNFGVRKPHWWYVYPLFALALLFGANYMFLLFNPNILDRTMYLQTLITLKVRIGHYLAFFVPLAATIGTVLYDRAEAAKNARNKA